MEEQPSREEVEAALDEYLDLIIEIWEDMCRGEHALTDESPERRMQADEQSIVHNPK